MRFVRSLLIIMSFLPVPNARAADPAAVPGAAESSVPEVTVTDRQEQRPVVPSTFGSSDIRDWYAPDSGTLIIDTYAHGKFKATFANRCTGIRFTDSIGFSTMGPYELDSSTTIVLPDGQRCWFRDLQVYTDEQERHDREARSRAKKTSAGD